MDELEELLKRLKELTDKAYCRAVAEEYLELERDYMAYNKAHPGETSKRLPPLTFEPMWMVCEGTRYDRALYEILCGIRTGVLPKSLNYHASVTEMKEQAKKCGYLTKDGALTEDGIAFIQEHEAWENS